jgi:hypothetical protein
MSTGITDELAIVWTESEKSSHVKILDRYNFLEFIMKFICEVPSIYKYSSF